MHILLVIVQSIRLVLQHRIQYLIQHRVHLLVLRTRILVTHQSTIIRMQSLLQLLILTHRQTSHQQHSQLVSSPVTLLQCRLVQMLLQDPLLSGLDAVFIDEVHERNIQIDFLLLLQDGISKITADTKMHVEKSLTGFFI